MYRAPLCLQYGCDPNPLSCWTSEGFLGSVDWLIQGAPEQVSVSLVRFPLNLNLADGGTTGRLTGMDGTLSVANFLSPQPVELRTDVEVSQRL